MTPPASAAGFRLRVPGAILLARGAPHAETSQETEMDLYTRTSMTSTRHHDLLNEATAERLAHDGDAPSLFAGLRQPVSRLQNRIIGLAAHGRNAGSNARAAVSPKTIGKSHSGS
jgi:hypothetical protein